MKIDKEFPDYIFESSWEVCNKVGGIYTVLSTRALTLQEKLHDKIFFIGPDCYKDNKDNVYFTEDQSLFADWQQEASKEGLKAKVGRWNVPGNPIVFLVDFQPFYAHKNDIYGKLWEDFQVDSLHAYGDYDEASMFSYAAARVVESFYHFYHLEKKKVVYHGNEWMTGLGLLYVKKYLPGVATIFTTHATSIGRSIAGNGKPLYNYLNAYNGDQMACELNIQRKHSIEKQTAKNVDCFTTVSKITAMECRDLLDKPVDVVLPNGFEPDFMPKGADFTHKRKQARKRFLQVANALTGSEFDDNTLIISTSGRYEFRNKGIDLFIDSMNRLRQNSSLDRNIVAFICVPAWVAGPREDLQERLKRGGTYTTPLDNPVITHWLHNMNDDRTLGMMRYHDMQNRLGEKVKVIFVPCYLTGEDGIMNLSYYDLILGNDLCIYPSYYEPWGYTPLEAIAFKVPCITTDLAGFGQWVDSECGRPGELSDGVKVVHRSDYDYNEVADTICESVLQFSKLNNEAVKACRSKAAQLSTKAYWSKFITYYEDAYDFALRKAEKRTIE